MKDKSELTAKYNLLHKVFEELLVSQFALSELRDFWRVKAGLKRKTNYSQEQKSKYGVK